MYLCQVRISFEYKRQPCTVATDLLAVSILFRRNTLWISWLYYSIILKLFWLCSLLSTFLPFATAFLCVQTALTATLLFLLASVAKGEFGAQCSAVDSLVQLLCVPRVHDATARALLSTSRTDQLINPFSSFLPLPPLRYTIRT